jgi:hypothetical protein
VTACARKRLIWMFQRAPQNSRPPRAFDLLFGDHIAVARVIAGDAARATLEKLRCLVVPNSPPIGGKLAKSRNKATYVEGLCYNGELGWSRSRISTPSTRRCLTRQSTGTSVSSYPSNWSFAR